MEINDKEVINLAEATVNIVILKFICNSTRI